MCEIETRFGADDDAEEIRAAFYGFVEAHADDADAYARISTEIDAGGPRVSVRLWSEAAMAAFLSGLHAAERPDRRRAYE